jgi:hypothetical protein
VLRYILYACIFILTTTLNFSFIVKVNLGDIEKTQPKSMHKHIYKTPRGYRRVLIPALNGFEEPVHVAIEVPLELVSIIKAIVIASVEEASRFLLQTGILYNQAKIVETEKGWNYTSSGSKITEFDVPGGPLLPFLTLLMVAKKLSSHSESAVRSIDLRISIELYNEKNYSIVSDKISVYDVPEKSNESNDYFRKMLEGFKTNNPSGARYVIQSLFTRLISMAVVAKNSVRVTNAPAATYFVQDKADSSYFGFTDSPSNVRHMPTKELFDIDSVVNCNEKDGDGDKDEEDDEDEELVVHENSVLANLRNEYIPFGGIFPPGIMRETLVRQGSSREHLATGVQRYIPNIRHALGQGVGFKSTDKAFNIPLAMCDNKTNWRKLETDTKEFLNMLLTNIGSMSKGIILNRVEIKSIPKDSIESANEVIVENLALITDELKNGLQGYKADSFNKLAQFYAMAFEASNIQ